MKCNWKILWEGASQLLTGSSHFSISYTFVFSCAAHRWRRWCWRFSNTTTVLTSSSEKLYSEYMAAVVRTYTKVEGVWLPKMFFSLRLPPQNIDLRLMRPRRACLVAVATTALTRSSAGGPNTARPQRDTLTAVGIVGAAATDWPWPRSWFQKKKKEKKPATPKAVCESLSHSLLWAFRAAAVGEAVESMATEQGGIMD